MEENLAIEIKEYLQDNIITDSSDLLELESIDEQILKCWDENIDDMRVDINCVSKENLKKIKGIGNKLKSRTSLKPNLIISGSCIVVIAISSTIFIK